ncbi:MAG: DNA helicase UvrB, partial [Rhodopirellula sp.]|nr:DNA helicase UvrB [Rhodopirellula sp.]
MFHVPTNETWDPEAIAERLREQNLEAIVLADSVRITLPTTPPSNLFERLLNFVARTGPHYMVLSFDRRQFISNIAAEYNPLKISTDTKVFT